LDLSEQQVANFKFDFLERLRTIVRAARLSDDVFPELHE
jgi:RNA polymerase sigma-70 factor (ECF subfamily)